ncbi:melanoma antigen preferentially expressed in tumors-like [Suncus etruscus]|uniref:melanoma antigen preferentially expressed in tumors-like n=1 Tax=Suncus etruscus TaxID=109475 RepID=UPI00210F5157|nr:melanoma antigen preferentially expressed in tumors-like [Suncus etruscus]
MDQESVPTLMDFAAKSLLSNEPIAIQSLEVLPKQLYIPLFKNAFLGRHKKVLNAMVRVWPFHCLHIGTLDIQEPPYEILEAILDGLQFLPIQNTSSGGPKLRILDLRQSQDCGITCYYGFQQKLCSHSCVNSQNSILKIEEVQHRGMVSETVTSESASSWKPIELLVNLSFNSNLRTKQFLLLLKSKIEQSFGSLHLCCRYLQINHISMYTSNLQILDPACVDHLEVNRVHLSKIITLFPQLIHLNRLMLSSIPFQSCNGSNFETFLTWLGKLDMLQELSVSFFSLTDQLHKALSILQSYAHLNSLRLPFCQLSNKDLTVLSQSDLVTHLTRLDLSSNQIFWRGYEPFLALLVRVSGTLQHLEINNCKITDSELSAILPALSHCSHLRVLSLAYNSLTMAALVNLLKSLIALSNLRRVVYPVPLHCYELGRIEGHLDRNKLAEAKAHLNLVLQMAQRNDIYWTIL